MDYFHRKGNEFYCEAVPVKTIAEQFGTPTYLYSQKTIEQHYQVFTEAAAPQDYLICYSVKANSNLAILNVLAKLGAGFDIVSGGELARVLKAGADPQQVVFSGVGKTRQEMIDAMNAEIYCFNVESPSEIDRLAEVAKTLHKRAPISIRINPNINPKTHPYISTGLEENKFGIEIEEAFKLYLKCAKNPNFEIKGVDCHIGSQITELSPFVESTQILLNFTDRLEARDIKISHLDIGGGFAAPYHQEKTPLPQEYADKLTELLNHRQLKIIFEPGRAIMANAGILLTRVEYIKTTGKHHFAIVDAAMNDLLRPALYNAWQEIVPVIEKPGLSPKIYNVVGPVCETGDFLGKDRSLAIAEEDLLAIRSAGAYGFSMSSNYNSRPRAAEVLVKDDQYIEIRQRETLEQLLSNERIIE